MTIAPSASRLRQHLSISSTRLHLVNGGPVDAILNAARALCASVVVIGAGSRSGLKRMFIGNTAERVLNALPFDVFVVKAPGFAIEGR